MTPPVVGTVLAFDFGEKRIGVATGDFALQLATPLTTLTADTVDARFTAVGKLIAEWQPVWLVVGTPAYPDGTPHPIAKLTAKFARQLEGRFRLPVTQVDESYTSSIATSQLHEQGVASKAHKGKLDQLAAQQILQAFFDGGCV